MGWYSRCGGGIFFFVNGIIWSYMTISGEEFGSNVAGEQLEASFGQ